MISSILAHSQISFMKVFTLFFFLSLVSFSLLAINPVREYKVRPEMLGMKYETQKIQVNSNVQLNSWLFLGDQTRPFIIVSNSDAGNMANCLGQAQEFSKAGYNVILYDYRGFGESSDFEMDRNRLYYDEFVEDLNAVLVFTRKVYKPKKLILYGLSMGTIISRTAMDQHKWVSGGIFDSFVVNPNLVVDRIFQLKKKEISLPNGAVLYNKINESPAGVSILIFSGLQDIITKSTDYTSFLKINPKARVVTWDCNHLENFHTMTKDKDSDLYMAAVNEYINNLK